MKRALIISSLLFSHISLATDLSTGPNNVYIQQLGTSNTITIEQVGGTNNISGHAGITSVDSGGITTITPDIASSSNYAVINGSNNIFNISQHGSNDWAQYNIRGNDNTYTSTIIGSSNQTQLVIGDQNNTSNQYNIINESITGDNNLSIQNIIGKYITSTLTISGNSNQITQNLTGNSGTGSSAGSHDTTNFNISGGSNIINAEQTDVGIHSLIETITGNSNAITTQQQGANNTSINIDTQGGFNTITVRTSSSSLVSPQSAIAR
jgi:hypothetical protein